MIKIKLWRFYWFPRLYIVAYPKFYDVNFWFLCWYVTFDIERGAKK